MRSRAGNAAAGYRVVMQDILLDDDLQRFIQMVPARPVYAVVLTPDAAALRAREQGRAKSGYGTWSTSDFARDAIQTPGGWHLDTSDWSIQQTVTHIQDNLERAKVM